MGSHLRPTVSHHPIFFNQCDISAVRLLLTVWNILSQESIFSLQLSLLWLFKMGQSLAGRTRGGRAQLWFV